MILGTDFGDQYSFWWLSANRQVTTDLQSVDLPDSWMTSQASGA